MREWKSKQHNMRFDAQTKTSFLYCEIEWWNHSYLLFSPVTAFKIGSSIPIPLAWAADDFFVLWFFSWKTKNHKTLLFSAIKAELSYSNIGTECHWLSKVRIGQKRLYIHILPLARNRSFTWLLLLWTKKNRSGTENIELFLLPFYPFRIRTEFQ